MLRLGDAHEPFLLTRYNGHLYTFFGNLATRNHVFLQTGETVDNVTPGVCIFSFANIYSTLASFMLRHDYPMVLNALEVPPGDEATFKKALDQMEGSFDSDFIPDEWVEDGQ